MTVNLKQVGSKVKRKNEIQCYEYHEFGNIKKNCPYRKKMDGKTHENIVGYASYRDIFTISKVINTLSRDR